MHVDSGTTPLKSEIFQFPQNLSATARKKDLVKY